MLACVVLAVHDDRPDRDQFIEIQTQNVFPGRIENFAKKSSHEINSLGQPYDLQSIMHYKQVNSFNLHSHWPITVLHV